MPTNRGESKYGEGKEPFRDIEEGEYPNVYNRRKARAIYKGEAKDDFSNPWLSYMGWNEPESQMRLDYENSLRHEKDAGFNTFKINNFKLND